MILDEDMTEEELEKLASVGTEEQKRVVARNPNTRPATLLALAEEGFAGDVDENPMFILYVEGDQEEAIQVLPLVAKQTKRVERLEALASYPSEKVRRRVAENEMTPVATLKRLAMDKDPDVREGVARNKNTDVDTLDILSKDKSAFVRGSVAENTNTTEAALGTLRNDKFQDIRADAEKNLASKKERKGNPVEDNGDLTEDDLDRLAQGTDEQKRLAARHPATRLATLVQLANNGFAEEVDQNPLMLFYAEEGQPKGLLILFFVACQTKRVERLEELASYPSEKVRDGVAMNANTPVATLEILAKDKGKDVRWLVAKNANTPIANLEVLAMDKEADVRDAAEKNLASRKERKGNPVEDNGDLTEDDLDRLAQGTDEEKRLAARHPATRLATLLALAEDNFADEVDENPMLLFYVEGDQEEAILILQYLAWQTKRVERLEELASYCDNDVRRGVSRNANTSMATLKHLAKDKDEFVRRGVAMNASTPVATLEQLAKGKELFVSEPAKENLASRKERKGNPVEDNGDLTEDDLDRLAEGTDEEKRLAARHPATRLATLFTLARKGFALEVEENPMFPLYIETEQREALQILPFVAKQTKRGERLKELASYGYENLSARVAENERTPGATLDLLAKDKAVTVRRAVAENTSTTGASLALLASDASEDVRWRVAENSSTPVATLELLAKDESEDVRWGVAENSSTPIALLDLLAMDEDDDVRETAVESLASKKN
jgi:3-methyladenine DNA glycosylase AlkC